MMLKVIVPVVGDRRTFYQSLKAGDTLNLTDELGNTFVIHAMTDEDAIKEIQSALHTSR